VLEGQPAVVIRDGRPDEEVMAAERLTMTELRESARGHGIRRLEDVELAVLENNGNISFFKRETSAS
jgi:uncharacterized membrane protein YcaP (DUF421 family)